MLRSLITERVRPWHLVPALLVYLPLAVAMFAWPGLLSRVSESCAGLVPFDVRGLWTPEDARTMVNSCNAAGRTAYIQLEIVDLFYPAALAAVLLVVTALLLRGFGGRTWFLLLPIVAHGLSDYLENAGIWFLLLRWPDLNATVVTVAGAVTAVKRVFGMVAFSLPIIAAVALMLRRRHRGATPTRTAES